MKSKATTKASAKAAVPASAPAAEEHVTCCLNCQDHDKEVPVQLHPEDGVWKGVCDCGDEACFAVPPDMPLFSELGDEEREHGLNKARAASPGKELPLDIGGHMRPPMDDRNVRGMAAILYAEAIYKDAGGE